MNITDAGLYTYAPRADGQVVVITGAANGLGKAAALDFGRRRAKVVVGDIDQKSGEATVEGIRNNGGAAIFKRCDVTQWDNLLSLFELACSEYGSIDIVVANAGVSEIGSFMSGAGVDENGRPKPPKLETLRINLDSVLHTAYLAVHYFRQNTKENSLKSLVLMGSIASIMGLAAVPLYSSSKHGLLGFMRSIRHEFLVEGMRISLVAPWFADTGILNITNKIFLAGLPLTPVDRVGGAIFLAATDGGPDTNGAVYTLPDEGEVFRIPHSELNQGIYALLNKRVERVFNLSMNLKIYFGIIRTICELQGVRLLSILLICFMVSRLAVTNGWA